MEDHDKTKEQLINELHEIRQKVTKLEACCTPLFDTETMKDPEDRFRSLVECAPDAVFVQTAGMFAFLNRRALELFGASSPQDLLGKPVKERIHPDFHEAIQERIRLLNMEKKQVPSLEQIYLRMDGSPVDVDVSVVPINFQGQDGALIFARDITERKLAEKALRESQQRLDLALKGADLGWWDLDLTTGRGLIDKRIYEIIEHSPGELECTLAVWQQLLHPDDLTGTLEHMQEHLQGHRDRLNYEYRIRKKSGEYAWVMAQGKIVEHDQDNCPLRMTGTVMDITARKSVEETLRENEEIFFKAFHCAPVLMTMTGLENGTILEANETFLETSGFSRDEVIGQTSLELGWISREGRTLAIEAIKQNGSIRGVQLKLPTKDGSQVICLYNSQLIPMNKRPVILSIGHDVTERVQAQEAQMRLTAAIEQATEGVVIMDPEGRIEYVNHGYEHITGYRRDEVLEKRHHLFEPSEHDEAFYIDVQETLLKGTNWSGRFARTRKDGSSYTEDIILSPVRSSVGKIVNYVALKRDVSKELSMQYQLLQAQKMEAVGTLAGGIAHDFNNILQVVLGYSEFLLAAKEKTDNEYADLDKIYSASRRGADLVQNLMMFSRKVQPNLKPLNLNDEIVQIQKLLSRTIPKNIKINVHLSGDLELVEADISQMGQVLMNLAVNARDAMPDGGKLNFETSNVNLDEDYCATHPNFQPGNYALLGVSDTGIGMDEETLSHIFEPFFTTKGVGHGTGLGLATVFGIIKQHKGHITCESEMGTGTTFKIYIPAIEKKLEGGAQESRTPIVGGTETILLVDDEEHLRDLGSTILKRYGYEVLTTENGREALEAYIREREKISLIVLDLIMPEMDGKKCLSEILHINPKAKVLIASGYSPISPTIPSLLPGAKGLVAKPYQMRKLLKAVREVLDAV